MRAIRSGFLQMLVFMRRDMMLSAACLAPVLAGLGIRFGIPFLEAVLTERFSKSAVLSPLLCANRHIPLHALPRHVLLYLGHGLPGGGR